jgi:hypothetical protein
MLSSLLIWKLVLHLLHLWYVLILLVLNTLVLGVLIWFLNLVLSIHLRFFCVTRLLSFNVPVIYLIKLIHVLSIIVSIFLVNKVINIIITIIIYLLIFFILLIILVNVIRVLFLIYHFLIHI